jgi:SAM-dependent methyltransferase
MKTNQLASTKGTTITLAIYEPPPLEIKTTLALGLTVLSPYYRGFARSLSLLGNERVLDLGSGSGIRSRHIAARLHRCGGQLDCVDISHGWSKVICKTLERYRNVTYHLGHITQLDLPESAHDAVVIHFCPTRHSGQRTAGRRPPPSTPAGPWWPAIHPRAAAIHIPGRDPAADGGEWADQTSVEANRGHDPGPGLRSDFHC